MNLNGDLQRVGTELEDVRNTIREETADLFEFDVVVGGVNYNANKNSISVTVEPTSQAREQLSERFGGVDVTTDGAMELEYTLTSDADDR